MKKARLVLFLLAIVGLIASILLTQLHYKVEKSGFDEKSFCNVSEFIDCDAVVASQYSSVRTSLLSVPNSELGILYYLLVLIGLVYVALKGNGQEAGSGVNQAGLNGIQRGTLGFLFLSMIFANAYSVYMAYLSLSVLGVLCAMCFTTYVVNFLMLLVFPMALGVSYGHVPAFIGRYLSSLTGTADDNLRPRLAIHLVGTVLLAGFGIIFFRGLNPEAHRPYRPIPKELYLKAFRELPMQDIDVSGRPYWGNPNAKVKIVEFSDFQCPFCRRAAFTLKSFLKAYKNDVALYFMNFPLDPTCNPVIQHTGHPLACLAAKAAVCASKQGKFWTYYERVFENQRKLSMSALIEMAAAENLNGPAFENCLASDEALEVIKSDAAQGVSLKIERTPTIYINGRFFRDWPDSERLRMVIEDEKSR